MKVLVYSSLTVIAFLVFQVVADEENVQDKMKSVINDAYNNYKDEIDDLKKKVDGLKTKAEGAFKETTQDLERKVHGLVDAVREKRSAQTFPDSTKSPTDDALERVNSAYNSLKDSVSSFFSNVSNSEVVSDVKSHLDNLKNQLHDASTVVKAKIHNITAESSEEKH